MAVSVSMSPRTVTMAWPSEGVVADCNNGAMAASLRGATRPTRLPSRQPPGLRQVLAPAVRLVGDDRSHVGGLGALLTLGDVELDGLAFLQRAVALDGAGMHEHVVAGFGFDEAVALVGVEPLNGSDSHAACPPSVTSEVSTTPAPADAGGK